MGKTYDVLVAGAGPVGSYTAYKLAEYGHSVAVFERNSTIGEDVCCTGIIGKECFSRFPVAHNAVLNEVKSVKLLSPSGNLLHLKMETEQAYVISRVDFDIALSQRAQDEGVEYFTSSKVEDIEISNDDVVAKVEHSGQYRNVRGRVAIDCTGFTGSLTRKLGMGGIGDFVLGAQAEVDASDLDEIEVYFGQSIAPGFFAWLVPTYPGKALAGLLTRKKTGQYLKSFLSYLTRQGKIRLTDSQLNYGGIPILPPSKTYTKRLLAVGDAAGQVKPTTGGGVYYGLICANIAADTANQALNIGDLSKKNLSGYETGWRGVLGKELQIGYLARRMYENLSDQQIERIFDLVKEYNLHNELLNSPDFSFDWHSGPLLKTLRHKIIGKNIRSMLKIKFPLLNR